MYTNQVLLSLGLYNGVTYAERLSIMLSLVGYYEIMYVGLSDITFISSF
jgi:hypothetical protein